MRRLAVIGLLLALVPLAAAAAPVTKAWQVPSVPPHSSLPRCVELPALGPVFDVCFAIPLGARKVTVMLDDGRDTMGGWIGFIHRDGSTTMSAFCLHGFEFPFIPPATLTLSVPTGAAHLAYRPDPAISTVACLGGTLPTAGTITATFA